MKKNKYNFIVCAICIICTACFSSCEDRLDINPKSYYVKGGLFQDVKQAEMSVKGIYDVFSKTETYSLMISMNYPLDNDVSYIKGTGFTSNNRAISHYGLNPNISYLEKTWSYLYTGIEYANVAIESISSMDMYEKGSKEEQEILRSLVGEAKFLRAFIYFDLVRLWGGVPLKSTCTKSSDNYMLARASRNEVLDFIISDLRSANELISPLRLSNDRANKGAISGYLVRALVYRAGYYLDTDGVNKRCDDYKEYMKQAAVVAKQMIDSKEYELLKSYQDVFQNLGSFKQDASENLFEIAFYNVSQGREDSGMISTWNSTKVTEGKYGRANAYVLVQPEFVNEFEENDNRKNVAVADFYINKKGKHIKIKKGKPLYPGKWRRDWITEPALDKNNTNVNWCTLRYADVLLMFAEAVNESRNDLPTGISLADAFGAINTVRTRAGLKNIDSNLSYKDMFKAIKHERKIELSFEGWRKYDLVRWNILGDKLRETQKILSEKYKAGNIYNNKLGYMAGVTFIDNKHELLPIPQRECEENKTLIQNPNY